MQDNIGFDIQKPQKNIGIIFAYMYILLSFIGQPSIMVEQWHQFSLYALLGVGVLTIVFNISRFRLIHYYIWYAVLIFISIFSCLYAHDLDVALHSVYNLIVVLGVTVSISVMVKEKIDIRKILVCFSVSGFALFMILLLTNQLIVEERLGQDLFGNANSFAMTVMMSLICSIWLAMYSNGYKKNIYIIFGFVQYYMLSLSGGRKYILVPLAFFSLLFILKIDTKKKSEMVGYVVVSTAISAMAYWAIFNIPQLYDSIGYRMEGFVNLLTGQEQTVINSDIVRKNMIESGLDFFTERPVFGYGLDNYQLVYGAAFGTYVYSHNNYVETLVNLGMVGFIIYYSFYVFLIRKLWVKRDDLTKLRDFFLAFMISLLLLEMGAVTYNLNLLQVFIALASGFLVIRGD